MALPTPPSRRPSAGPRFQYAPRDKDSLTQRSQKYASRGRDVWLNPIASVYTPKKGENWLRILPPAWEHAKHYGYDLHLHYGIGPDFTTFACPQRMQGKPCPICEERTRLTAQGEEEAAQELRATFRLMTYVIDRKEAEKGAQIWLMPMSIDRELITLCQDSRTGEVLWLDDPEKGYDIEFTRSGEGLQTKYTGIRIARSPTPLDAPGALEFIAAHPLPELVIMSEPSVMAETLVGTVHKSSRPEAAEATQAPHAEASPAAPARPSALAQRRPAPTTPPPPPKATAEAQLNAALDAMATYDLGIPDTVSDADLPHEVAKALGEAVHEFPALVGLA